MAEKIGCNFRSWQDYEAGKTIPGGAILSELVKLGINANWLLSSEGCMLIADCKSNSCSDDLVEINVYKNIKRDNGKDSILSKVYISKKLFYRMDASYSLDDLGIVEIQDSSMKPTLKKGDMVLIDFSVKSITNGIMAFSYNNVDYIRKVIPDFDGCDIISDNKNSYNSIRVDSEKIQNMVVQGRVLKIVNRNV